MLDTPNTAIRVTPCTIRKFLSLNNFSWGNIVSYLEIAAIDETVSADFNRWKSCMSNYAPLLLRGVASLI